MQRTLMRADRLVILLALFAGCHRAEGEADPPSARKRVRCAAVRRQSLRETGELRGTVSPLPDRDAQLAPQVAGRILRVMVREGDRVASNQVVAQIDAASLEDQVKE